jgi:hypothetical protein
MQNMFHACADMVVVRRHKHLRFMFESAERGAMQDPGLIAGELKAEGIALHRKSATERPGALFCERRKFFLIFDEELDDIEFRFHTAFIIVKTSVMDAEANYKKSVPVLAHRPLVNGNPVGIQTQPDHTLGRKRLCTKLLKT